MQPGLVRAYRFVHTGHEFIWVRRVVMAVWSRVMLWRMVVGVVALLEMAVT